jgi:hypothetical protein
VDRSLFTVEGHHVLAQEESTYNQLCHTTGHRQPPYTLAIGAGMLTFASSTQTPHVSSVGLGSARDFLLPGPPELVAFMTQLQLSVSFGGVP